MGSTIPVDPEQAAGDNFPEQAAKKEQATTTGSQNPSRTKKHGRFSLGYEQKNPQLTGTKAHLSFPEALGKKGFISLGFWGGWNS